ncbi:uncharacterized protein TNCV_3725521 [Trichonephila clavipes]|nr:uncharacterized protein TNCV_3725521 [Trichonephila clavipes]
MSTESGKLISIKLSFQMNHASICGTMLATFVLDSMPVNAVFQSALSNDIVVKHPELCFGVGFRMMDDSICYELKQDNARPRVAKTVQDFRFAQPMLAFPWPVYSSHMSPIEHVWDLAGRRLARDPHPVASKNFCYTYKQLGIFFHMQTFKICLTPCPWLAKLTDVPYILGSNPEKTWKFCKCVIPSWHGDTLNSSRAEKSSYVVGGKGWEAPDHPDVFFLKIRIKNGINHTFTCIVLKSTDNEMRHLALFHEEFRGPRSGLCLSGGISNNNNNVYQIFYIAGPQWD